jgi:hypothetical protein
MRRLEDKIRELCAKATATSNSTELNEIFAQLKASLREHIQRFRRSASKYPYGRERRQLPSVEKPGRLFMQLPNASRPRSLESAPSFLCEPCDRLLSLETAKRDDDGKSVHEECHAQKLKPETTTDGRGRRAP